MTHSRLDILIYAHDGRGLGHAGRSIGIGMALRRLFPHLKVLFVSGCRQSQELIGASLLDWIKLPSYETVVHGGKSTGIPGKSGFSDYQLGFYRAREIEHLVRMYQPRLVLVDHTPQGKHRELVPALELGREIGTQWVLGVRGVVGAVSQAGSELAGDLFRKYYRDILWYGDREVLGGAHADQLLQQYGMVPMECGYVSRLAEVASRQGDTFINSSEGRNLAGTVSVPWLGEKSLGFLEQLAEALAGVPGDYGDWRLFVDTGGSVKVKKNVWEMFSGLRHCWLEEPGQRYGDALMHSRTAVIYGGYNSLIDILFSGLPALVVEREMRDNEQQLHLHRLQKKIGNRIHVIPESEVSAEQIVSFLLDNLSKERVVTAPVNLGGATEGAVILNQILLEEVGL